MKKLTEKDAIWCKTQKQWEKVLKFLGTKNNLHFYEKGVTDVILVGGGICSLHTANHHKHPVHKAKDILNKSFKKDVLKRLEKIENVISDNTTISKMESVEPLKFDLPTKELEELPEKWCVRDCKKVTDWVIKKNPSWGKIVEDNLYHYSEDPDIEGFHEEILQGYTEITFDQFKKWVLK